jgi:colicin import membrane protein
MNNTSIRICFNFNLKIIIAIFFIAVKSYITPAIAESNEKNAQINSETTISAELGKIKQEKSSIEAKSKEQEAACYKKFAVSNCLQEVKTEKLAALNKVKRREIELNDQLRAIKAESVQSKLSKKAASSSTDPAKQSSNETGDGSRGRQKTTNTPKAEKPIKSDDEILLKKNADEQSRVNAAQKRVAESNKKLAASQKKAQIRANKSSQADVNSAKYNKKLSEAEEHKSEAEKAKLAKSTKTKPKSAPLPIPTAEEIAR